MRLLDVFDRLGNDAKPVRTYPVRTLHVTIAFAVRCFVEFRWKPENFVYHRPPDRLTPRRLSASVATRSQRASVWVTIDDLPMTHRLPMLAGREDATRACAYCPKLCRPACPVATVTGNDAVSAWGIMASLASQAEGTEPASAERLGRAYACTGCDACQSHCELDNPVAETLRDARSQALAAGVAPATVSAFLASVPLRDERVRDHARQVGSTTDRPTGVALVSGCSLAATDVPRLAAMHRAFERWFGEAALVADLCCGGSLLDAGDVEGFRARSAALTDRLRAASAVVVLDSGCAHAMSTLASRRGLETVAVETLEAFVARSVRRLPEGALADRGPFAVHDACKLGRGAGQYDAPRTVIEHLTGRPPVELRDRREHARCSGGGGLLPRTHSAIADAMSDELAESVRASGASAVVTGCPTSRARLERQGLEAFTVADLLCDLSRGTSK